MCACVCAMGEMCRPLLLQRTEWRCSQRLAALCFTPVKVYSPPFWSIGEWGRGEEGRIVVYTTGGMVVDLLDSSWQRSAWCPFTQQHPSIRTVKIRFGLSSLLCVALSSNICICVCVCIWLHSGTGLLLLLPRTRLPAGCLRQIVREWERAHSSAAPCKVGKGKRWIMMMIWCPLCCVARQ